MTRGTSKPILIILHVEQNGTVLTEKHFQNLPHAELISFANFPHSSEVVSSVFQSIKDLLHTLEFNNQLLQFKRKRLSGDGIDNNCTAILHRKSAEHA